jgi:RND superfamily putative drug exporter
MMFERLGSLTYRFRFVIVLAWIAGAAWSIFFAPSLAAEGMTDQTAFLPSYTASMQAHDSLERTFPGSTSVSSATISFSRDGGLTDADRAFMADTASWITGDESPSSLRDAVTSVDTAASRPELVSMLRSADGALEMMNVNLNVVMAGSAGDVVVGSLREHLASAPEGLAAHVTGAAGIGSDYLAAIVTGTDSTTLVTILLVVVILLLIYRAPLAAMIPLVTIGAAFLVARGVLGVLALAGWKISSLLDTFIVVLIFGVGTDYAIFLISRFREEVARGDWHDASRATVGRIGAVITASAATVIVGLGAMAFGDFGMIQTTGPALAVGIFVTLIAGLTLAPALLAIFGHYLFWPRHTRTEPEGEPGGFFARLAAAVSRHPGLVTAVLLIVLLIPVAAVPQMRTNFDVLAELPADSDARAGFEQVATHLGRGKVFQSTGVVDGGPDADLLAPASLARLLGVMQELSATPGIATATSLVTPDGDGTLPDGFRPSRQLDEMARGFERDDSSAGAPVDAEALMDAEVSDGLDTATTYVELLGAAFPDVAAGPELRAVTSGLAKARDQVQQARDGAVVSTQLRALSGAMTSPAAGAGESGTSIGIVGDYLDELAAAFPEVEKLPALDGARAAVTSLTKKVSITAALDLADALEALATHFDGRTDATLFPDSLAGTAEAKKLRREVEATFEQLPVDLDGLATVFAARSDDVFVPTGLGGDDGKKLDDAVAAFVSTDRAATRFYVSTTDDPYSASAFTTVHRAQEILAGAAPSFGSGAAAHLGGTTAQFADVQEVLGSDMERVGLITVIGILLVLMILLRAVVAPLYLVGTVLLSYGTAMGISSWLFQTVLGQPGVSFYLPLLVFVLLVALGSDYNIFLMSRVREESAGRPIRDGIRIASGHTGAVITSAGLILAGTFGSMATAPLVVLFQVGVAVAIGVLIDTFLVRSILVPAITTLVGERAWWPSGAGFAAARRRWPVVVSIPEPGAAGTSGSSRRRLGIALAMVALVPMLVAGLFVWALAEPSANLDGVTAAIVNLDEGATISAEDGTERRLDLGADLADQLATGTDAATFHWVGTDADDARAGLEDGRYGAVLTIPTGFSSTIASITDGTTRAATKAKVHLETNDGTSYALGTIARSISAAIVASTAQTATAGYVDHVLLGINDTQAGMAGAADGADRVVSGSANLVDGATGTSAVADELVTGLAELADGASTAGDGVGRLASGVKDLASGTGRLADGVAGLGDGAHAAAKGAGGIADGAASLAGGLGKLSSGTADLPGQAAALATGANGVADGAAGVATGSRALADSLAQMQAGTTGLGDQAKALNDGAAALESGAKSLRSGAAQTADAASGLAGGAQTLSASVADYTDAVGSLAGSCAALGGSDPLCAQLQALAATNGQLTGGASSVADGAAELAAANANLAAGAADVASGADSVHAGTHQLAASAPQLEGGIAQASTGAGSLAAGASDLASGAKALAAGTATFASSAPALSKAVADAERGARQLADGADGVATGVSQLARGADKLETGARTAAAGASTLASGTSAAAGGAAKLASGMNDAADGARLVQAELDGLASDGQSLADQATELATTLRDKASEIGSYPDAARAELGSLVADPISVESSRLNAIATGGSGLASYYLALALWVGALAAYVVLPALLGPFDRQRWWLRALVGFGAGALIGVAQALLAVLVLRFAVGVEVARLPELIAVAMLAAVVFVAIVQALVALFDRRGWIIALLLGILQLTAAGAVFPIETAPAFLQFLHPFLPMTYAVEAFQALIAGDGPALAPAVVVLVLWLAGALGVTLAVAHHEATQSEEPAPAAA